MPTLGLAIGRVLDLEPVLAILTIHSGLALGDNSFEVASADFRKQFLSCALYMLGIQQNGTVAHASEFRETGFPLEERRPPGDPRRQATVGRTRTGPAPLSGRATG